MKIILNGRAMFVDNVVLKYEQICQLAELDANCNPSMTYRTPSGAGGTLSRGDGIGVTEGLILSVCYTGAA